jgi:hypothetical protein
VSASTFFNRQPLYLRPDPSRVVVRPFRLASEPRDLNPTDWKRADHIVGRVLAMDADTTASLLDDVLQNFEGRHRNLLAKCEARAAEMESARPTPLSRALSVSWSARISCTNIRSRRQPSSTRASCRIPIKPASLVMLPT